LGGRSEFRFTYDGGEFQSMSCESLPRRTVILSYTSRLAPRPASILSPQPTLEHAVCHLAFTLFLWVFVPVLWNEVGKGGPLLCNGLRNVY
jgi:hypothetical protein